MIRIVTTVAAWPAAILAMRSKIKRHLKEEFELVVFIDTPSSPGPYNLWDSQLREKAIELVASVADRYYVVPEELHKHRGARFPGIKVKSANSANNRAADTLQYAWDEEISKSEYPVLLLDNDMFPIHDFSVMDILGVSSVAGILTQSQSPDLSVSIPWIWSGLLFLNVPRMKNKELWSFACGKVKGVPVDVAGHTHYWLESMMLQGLSPKWLTHHASLNWTLRGSPISFGNEMEAFLQADDRNQGDALYCELYHNTFLHFRAGSNWKKESAEVVSKRNCEFLRALMA